MERSTGYRHVNDSRQFAFYKFPAYLQTGTSILKHFEVEHNLEKRKNMGNQNFLLFPECFQHFKDHLHHLSLNETVACKCFQIES